MQSTSTYCWGQLYELTLDIVHENRRAATFEPGHRSARARRGSHVEHAAAVAACVARCVRSRAQGLSVGTVSLSDELGTLAAVQLYWLAAGIGVSWASDAQPELPLGPYARFGYALAHSAVNAEGPYYRAQSGASFVAIVGAQAQLRAALDARTWALIGFDIGYV